MNENTAADGTFAQETDWAVVAFEMHGSTVPPAPNVDPAAAFGYICSERDCNFVDGSSDIDGTVVVWSWNFDDDNESSAQNPSHSYAVDDTYMVSLTVTDNDGAKNSVGQSVTVAAASLPPAAPTNLTASVESTGRGKKKVVTVVMLNWTDNADNEDEFVIERCQQTGKGKNKTCNFAEIDVVGENITSFSDSDSLGSGKYKYRVKARIDTVWDSAYTNTVKI